MKHSRGYSAIQIALHWLVVVLVVVQFVSGDWMSEYFRALVRATEGRPETGAAIWHIVTGALILAAMLMRLAMRFTHGVPPDSPASPGWDRMLSRVVHGLLYLMLFAMPLTGLAAWLIPSREIGEIHETGKVVILALVGLHVAGALYHQVILGDRLIRRMMVPERADLHVPPIRPN